MKFQPNRRFSFLILVNVLVLALGIMVGYRLGTGLTFRQLIGLAQSKPPSQLLRIRNTDTPSVYNDVDFSLFWETWNRLERDYVDPQKLDAQQMVYGAIAGMTEAVGDPYTVFLPPENKQRLTEDLQGEFNGVGIELGYLDGQLAVIAPLKDHPAEKVGVKAGDYILRIKDEAKEIDQDALGLTAEEAVTIIRGKKNTPVKLTLLTKGEEPREVEIFRDTIEIPSLEANYLDRNGRTYAHIELSRFGDKTIQEWDKVVAELPEKNIDGIIVDVRGNPGGYLQAAIDLASDFFNGGVVVSQKGRVLNESYRTTRSARVDNFPVVVLVNKGSASASEILAGALRDRRGAKLIGEQTFGKGTVQDAQQLPGGAGLNITIGRWLLPSGSSIQDEGLSVDIEVKDNPDTEPDEVLDRAIEEL